MGYAVTQDTLRARSAICIVGEAPGDAEERTGRPFVGRSGEELDKALHRAGFPRQQALVTNVLLCRPPKNELRDLLQRIKHENTSRADAHKKAVKEAHKAGLPLPPPPEYIMSPIDCCKPRFDREIAAFENFLTLGKTATMAVTGNKAAIGAVRGSLTELEPTPLTPKRKVLPTVHPAFCLRYPKWFHVFHADVTKAGQWFRGEISWSPPVVYWQPSPEQLQHFIDRHKGQILTADIETDGIEPLTAKIRCIGLGTENEVLVVSVLSKDGHTRFYPPEQEAEIIQILCRWLADPDAPIAGHNFGSYDKTVLRTQWGANCQNIIDTILLHRVVESEMPHSLAYVVSMFTIAPAWKTDRDGNKLSTDSETDEELALYNAMDVALNARVLQALVEQAEKKDQLSVYFGDLKVQAVCVDMHTVGMYVDQAERQSIEIDALHRRNRVLSELRAKLGRPEFNPGSIYQLRDLFFDEWQLTPALTDEERLTSNDDPSTSDLVLRSLLTDPTVRDDHRDIISLVRRYRRLQKVLGTYIVKLRPSTVAVEGDLGWDDEDWGEDGRAAAEMRKRYGLERTGIVDPYTGRMYPGYSASVAVTGRLSSSKPINSMNFPSALRTMVTAAPGHVLVGADMDQLELRIAAARWGVKLYLRAFEQGKDPHSMTAFAVFGEAFCLAAGIDPRAFERDGILVGAAYDAAGKFAMKEGDAYKMRTLSKMVQYASQYKAMVETVAMLIRKTEVPARDEHGNERKDGTTELPFALMGLRKIREMHQNWLRGAPEFKSGWDKEINHFKKHGFVAEYVTGRKRYFLDTAQSVDDKMGGTNEIVNYPIQSSAAGLMNKAIIALHEEIPLNKWGPHTGIINQCHDSIVIECPADGCREVEVKDERTGKTKKKMIVVPGSIPDRVSRLLEECMNQTHPSLPGVVITASASVGRTWKEV
jgi:DNA polymerase I-like protein with 3'-5' exonuclease and polymerase domains/uracil-DNA glycosylase